MPNSPLSVGIQHLLADLRPEGDGMTDGDLLARFVGSRDADALAALVRRHASMVWGVCRRLLGHHDAEDAFQATFLVLVRKATDVPGLAVANWLYGVARQTAVRLRATTAKRGRRETQVVTMPEPTVPEVWDADVRAVVDEELSRLPDHYRGVVVLCDLEGLTRKAAARQLGIPEGSVASRLARARAMLARRLARRGVALSGGAVAAALSAGSASASAPPALVASTIRAASLLAAGQAGVVTAQVAALTEGVVRAMFVTKIKSVLAVMLVAGLVLGGFGLGSGLSMNPVAVAQQSGAKTDGQRGATGGRAAPVPDDKAAKDALEGKAPLPDAEKAANDALKGKAPLPGDKEKEKPKGDEKKLLPGEIKRELNQGVILQVKLEALDAKALLMTADVVTARDIAARGQGPNPKPLRLTNLMIAGNARVSDGNKDLKFTDLKAGNILRLQLESVPPANEEMVVTYIRVEGGPAKKPDGE